MRRGGYCHCLFLQFLPVAVKPPNRSCSRRRPRCRFGGASCHSALPERLRLVGSAATRFIMRYPDAIDPSLVGTFPALARAGGGYVWDAVLEYRVWCHPENGAAELEEGNDYYYSFATY